MFVGSFMLRYDRNILIELDSKFFRTENDTFRNIIGSLDSCNEYRRKRSLNFQQYSISHISLRSHVFLRIEKNLIDIVFNYQSRSSSTTDLMKPKWRWKVILHIRQNWFSEIDEIIWRCLTSVSIGSIFHIDLRGNLMLVDQMHGSNRNLKYFSEKLLSLIIHYIKLELHYITSLQRETKENEWYNDSQKKWQFHISFSVDSIFNGSIYNYISENRTKFSALDIRSYAYSYWS